MALAYRRYSMDYIDEEEDARGRGVGMWAGGFIVQWEWRRKRGGCAVRHSILEITE